MQEAAALADVGGFFKESEQVVIHFHIDGEKRQNNGRAENECEDPPFVAMDEPDNAVG